ncbi:MAG TPA: glycosyltransferase family 2 protein, partial [Coleofasciculaceae cyanobacterium]
MLINQLALLLIDISLFAITLGLLVPIIVLFIECTAALLPNRSEIWKAELQRPRIAVLIPAHNEASGIGGTLETVIHQLTSQDQLIVIADNCTDETARVVRSFGAIALERHDPSRLGKGYALDYGLQFMESNPPDVVVIIDADCRVEPGVIERIANTAITSNRPVQANYSMAPPTNPSPKD